MIAFQSIYFGFKVNFSSKLCVFHMVADFASHGIETFVKKDNFDFNSSLLYLHVITALLYVWMMKAF